MTKDEELLAQVCAEPERDDLRLALADALDPYDPDRSKLIRLALERATKRRKERTVIEPGPEEAALLDRNQERWGYTVASYAQSIHFDRGFVCDIGIEPSLFLGHGEALLRIAPIRHVDFVSDDRLEEVLASKVLSKLDSVSFSGARVDDATVALIAGAKTLARCLFLGLEKMTAPLEENSERSKLTLAAFHTIAASPNLKALLYVESYRTPLAMPVETGKVDREGRIVEELGPLPEEAVALEKKYGRLAWLHRQNWCVKYDARYFVDQGVLPSR